MLREEYVEVTEEPSTDLKPQVVPGKPLGRTFSSRQREPIHITYKTKDLSFYRTMIGAAALGLTQMVDPGSMRVAKSFGFFRTPLQRAYQQLLPILVEHDKALKSGNPYPRVRDMHSLSVTMNPASAEMVVRVTYQNSRNTHTIFMIRVVAINTEVQDFAEKLRDGFEGTDLELSNRL